MIWHPHERPKTKTKTKKSQRNHHAKHDTRAHRALPLPGETQRTLQTRPSKLGDGRDEAPRSHCGSRCRHGSLHHGGARRRAERGRAVQSTKRHVWSQGCHRRLQPDPPRSNDADPLSGAQAPDQCNALDRLGRPRWAIHRRADALPQRPGTDGAIHARSGQASVRRSPWRAIWKQPPSAQTEPRPRLAVAMQVSTCAHAFVHRVDARCTAPR